MTYPSSDVNTSRLDAGTDSPAAARPSLLDLAQKFNLLRGHISAFWQGVLATSSQAAARSALGAVGTADTIAQAAHAATADSATTAGSAAAVPWTGVSGRPTAVSAFTNDAGYLTTAFGYGQTIQEPSRALDTSYTNSSGKLRICTVVGTGAVGNLVGYINTGSGFVEGPIVTIPSSASFATLTLLVPIAATYKVDQQNGASIYKWQEY